MRSRLTTQGTPGQGLLLLTPMHFYFFQRPFWNHTQDNRWRISKKLLCLAVIVGARVSLKQISQRKYTDDDSRQNDLLL